MSWLTPLTGLLLATAVIPPLILLYFLKLRRKPQAISCTLLWKKSVEDLHANAPFQRLRRSLLLLLQLLVLILLALSVMQPQLAGGDAAGGKNVFLIDNSASMSATDDPDDKTRLARAKELAKARVEAMYEGGLFSKSPGESMVIAFSDRAEVSARFTRSKQQLLDAIDRIQLTHGETRIAQALELARAYTVNPNPDSDRAIADPASFEMFSDGRIQDLEEQVLRGESMLYTAIGEAEADNIAVGTISIERPYDRPTAVEVFASILNYNRTPIEADLQLSVDGTVVSISDSELPAATIDERSGVLTPGQNNVVFPPFEQPRGAVIEIGLLREDDLMADNTAQLVVAPPRQLRVALVNNTYQIGVRTALEALRFVDTIELLSAEQYERQAVAGALEQYDVVVVDDYEPTMMPEGRYLIFGAAPPLDGLNSFGEGDATLVLDTDTEHPAMRYAPMGDVFIGKYQKLQPDDDVTVLAEGSETPLVVAVSRGSMQVIYVAFNPLDSNWPRLRSMTNFIYDAVDYLGHFGEGLRSRGFYPGEALTTRLPSGATNITLAKPDGSTEQLREAEAADMTWGPIRLSGIYVMNWEADGEESSRAFAANMKVQQEGAIAPLPQIQIGSETVVGEGGGGSRYIALWPWAVGACLALLMLEWWVYHRKTFI